MSNTVRVTVTFTMQYDAGTYNDDAPLGQVRRQSAQEAENLARHVVHLALHGTPPTGLKHLPVRLEIHSISEPTVVFRETP